MRNLLPLLFVSFLAHGQAPPQGVTPQWDITQTIGALSAQADRLKPILDQLTPQDGAGYAPAHVWLAANILKKTAATSGELGQAELHLRRSLHTQPESIEAHALLGQLLLRTGRMCHMPRNIRIMRYLALR